jgi:hypothetical protein
MSTEYPIIRDFMYVDEHSSKFDISVAVDGSFNTLAADDLTVEQLEKIAVNLLRIASYNGGELYERFGLEHAFASDEDLVV